MTDPGAPRGGPPAPEPPEDGLSSASTPPADEASDAWGLLLAGLCAIRLVLTSHAPSIFDAGIAAGFAVLLLREALVGRGVDRRGVTLTAAALVIGGVGITASMHPLLSWWALPGWLGPFLGFALVRTQPAATRRRVVVGMALAGVMHNVVALHQHFIGYPQTLAAADALGLDPVTRGILAAGRPLGVSLSPDLAGGLALLTALVGLHLLLCRPSSSRGVAAPPTLLEAGGLAERALGITCVATGLGAVVLSRSAGTVLALLVVSGVIVTLRRGTIARVPRWVPAVGAGVVAAGAVLAFRGVGALTTSASERLANWAVGAELLFGHPLGVGLARFGPAYLAARGPEANVTAYAHNAFVHVGVELGWLGLGFGVVVAALAVRALGRLPVEQRAARVFLVGACLLFAVRALVDYDLQVGQLSTLAGVVFGLALPAHRDQLRTASARAGTVVLVGVTLVPLMGLVPREVLLKPFEPGAVVGDQNIGALLAYAEAHPGDPITNTLAARLLLLTLNRCRADGCAPVERRLRLLLQQQLDEDVPADGMHVVAGRLALLRGELEQAEAHARAALDDHHGAIAAWQLLLDTLDGSGPQARDAALEEAAVWLSPRQVASLRAAPVRVNRDEGEAP